MTTNTNITNTIQRKLAINAARGGNKGEVRTCGFGIYERLAAEPWLEDMVRRIRGGQTELKQQLPFRCAHYWEFRDGKRLQKNAVSESFLFQTTVDIDDAPDYDAVINRAMTLNEAAGPWQGMLLHMEWSARHKLHIDIRMPRGMTIEQTQRAYCRALGTPYDASCITPERIIFIAPKSEWIYTSEHWYEVLPDDELKERLKAFTDRGLTIDGRTIDGGDSRRAMTAKPAVREARESNYHGPTQPLLSMFDACLELAGLTVADLNTVGSRHQSLLSLLSVGLPKLMTEDDIMTCLERRAGEYAAEPDCRRLVHDFYGNYRADGRPMSRELRKILSDALRDGEGNGEEAAEPQRFSLDDEISRLPEMLPIGLKESLVGVPRNMYMPVLAAVMPICGAYADGVSVRYCDNRLQQLGLMSIIVGDQATGKSVCKDIVAEWQRQMDDHDRQEREKEEQWREARKTRRANERAPQDPHVLIRAVPVTISCSTLLKRFKNSRGHCLWSFGEELDTLRKTNGAGSWSSKYDVYRLAFDRGEWGQDYNSDQAETGVVPAIYNWSILGTYGALKKCFNHDNVENGLSSRIFFAEMPFSKFAPLPIFHARTASEDDAIQIAADALQEKHGYYDTPKLRDTFASWLEEKRTEAMLSADEALDTYRRRAAVIGFRCGAIAFLLNDEKETPSVLRFARLVAEYVVWEQCRLFGETLISDSAAANYSRRGVNVALFDELNDTFSIEDVKRIKGTNCSPSLPYQIISVWKKNGWVERIKKGIWKKKTQTQNIKTQNKAVD